MDKVILRSHEHYFNKHIGQIDADAQVLLYFTDKVVLKVPHGQTIWYQEKKPRGITRRLFGGSTITHELITGNKHEKLHLITATHDSEGRILTFRR